MSWLWVEGSGAVSAESIEARGKLLPSTTRHIVPIQATQQVLQGRRLAPQKGRLLLMGPQIESFKDDPAATIPGSRWMFTHQVGACHITRMVNSEGGSRFNASMRFQLVGIFAGVEALVEEYAWNWTQIDFVDSDLQPRALSRPWVQANVWFVRLIISGSENEPLPPAIDIDGSWSITVSSPTR
jgi:hypothetical protein